MLQIFTGCFHRTYLYKILIADFWQMSEEDVLVKELNLLDYNSHADIVKSVIDHFGHVSCIYAMISTHAIVIRIICKLCNVNVRYSVHCYGLQCDITQSRH